MSTRSLHKFYDNETQLKNDNPTSVIYRHWDGYIEGAGQDLINFLIELQPLEDNRFTDASYLSAKYVIYLARLFAKDWEKDPLNFLSVGIVPNGTDWGEEYVYKIICEIQGNGLPKILVNDFELLQGIEKV
tara:strand:- start:1423 stop:1815 length:393 start_codon:yes stop_codon:yes gene_type:complete